MWHHQNVKVPILMKRRWRRRITWTTWWSLWLGRQEAQKPSPMHCKQNKLHSLLCDTSAWIGQDAKKQVPSRGFNHVGLIILLSLILPLPSGEPTSRPGEPYTNSNGNRTPWGISFHDHSPHPHFSQHMILPKRTHSSTSETVSNVSRSWHSSIPAYGEFLAHLHNWAKLAKFQLLLYSQQYFSCSTPF